MKFVSELANAAGAKVLVFGAPKNRLLLNHTYDNALRIVEERLAVLAEICWQYNVSIGLEAVPKVYGGEFITSYKESAQIVKLVNHPGLVFHLDAGCTYLNGDSIGQAIEDTIDDIAHFHISQPKLSDFSSPEIYHYDAAKSLKSMGYDGWRCIEMLETDNASNAIITAVRFAKKFYSN